MNCWVIRTKRFNLNLFYAVTVRIFNSGFASLIDIYQRIMNSTIGLNICVIIGRIKK